MKISEIKRTDVVRWLETALTFLLGAQVWAATISDEHLSTVITATIMFAIVIDTGLKQFLSVKITKESLVPTIVVLIAALAGGANNYFSIVHIGKGDGNILRLIISGVAFILSQFSSKWFPSPEGKIIVEQESALLQMKKSRDADLSTLTRDKIR